MVKRSDKTFFIMPLSYPLVFLLSVHSLDRVLSIC